MKRLAAAAALLCAGCWVPLYPDDDLRPPPPRRVDYGDPLTRAETEKLLKAGVSDAVIIEKAKRSGAAKLSADDIVALKQAGASDDLVQQLIVNERAASRAVYAPSTTTYAYYDSWWGPTVSLGWYSHWGHSYRGHAHCGPRTRVGVRVGW